MLQHEPSTIADIWEQFSGLTSLLDADDDVDLWKAAVGHIIGDAQYLTARIADKKVVVLVRIGRCSHWLRPHQSWWVADADGGFAAPVGYGGSGYSRGGLPEFDWCLKWQWHADEREWFQTEKPRGKRRLQLRVAIPSRTRQHPQAAIHTTWTPEAPTGPVKAVQFYGFRKQESQWRLAAHWTCSEGLYDAGSCVQSDR
ncbi:MAG: hypothetical protein KY476_03355 [Planctomycetes bacterium]|nr:hypothetical protein [Planctomycetota bacterium]